MNIEAYKGIGYFGSITDDGMKVKESGGCETCANRRYQDGSNDSGVSFQSPTKLSPVEARTAVFNHEMEHVRRDRASATIENKEVVSQSVQIQTSLCPDCGASYVCGGLTRTTTKTQAPTIRPYTNQFLDIQV